MKMRMQQAFLVLFVLMIGACSKEPIEDTTIIKSKNAITVENELFSIVNNYRQSNNKTILEFSSVAYKYANLHTDYMIFKGSTNHDNFTSRATGIASEVNVSEVAENVAKNYTTALEAFENWMKSANHRKAIEGDFSHTAVSVKTDENGNFYFTQLFFKEVVSPK
jgi:uncharacterized protein YkwD